MQWWSYERWCEERNLHVLVVPQGLQGVGDREYADDGYLYIKGKKIDRYMVVQRYNGFDCLVKRDETANVSRFEALRWKILSHIMDLLKKQEALKGDIYDFLRCNVGPHSKCAYGMVNGELYCVELSRSEFGRIKAESGKVSGYDDLDPLDKLSMIPKNDKEQDLVQRWEILKEKINKYWAKAGDYSTAVYKLLRDQHPVMEKANRNSLIGSDYRSYYDMPVMFEVNGRLYPISCGIGSESDRKYWPTPMGLPLIKIS